MSRWREPAVIVVAMYVLVIALAGSGSIVAATDNTSTEDQQWWQSLTTSIIDINNYRSRLFQIRPTLVRFPGFATLGPWLADYRSTQGWRLAGERSVRSIDGRVGVFPYTRGYYSLVLFVSPDNNILYTGHNLQGYRGEEGRIEHMDVRNFMFDLDLYAAGRRLPTATDLGVPAFRHPDGSVVEKEEFYDAVALKNLQGEFIGLAYSNPAITDEVAVQTGLAALSYTQEAAAHIQNATGWVMHMDYAADKANPYFMELKKAEIERIIDVLRPDLIHFDQSTSTSRLMLNGFGPWSVHQFRTFLAENVSTEDLMAAGIHDLDTFDIRDYLQTRPWRGEHRTDAGYWRDERWLSDIIFRAHVVYIAELEHQYNQALYDAVKYSSRKIMGYEIPVSANVIPTFANAELLRETMDFPDFEWKMYATYGFFSNPDGYYPQGRLGWATRWAAQYSQTGHSIIHSYVDHQHTGSDFAELHKVMHFDALANRSALAFGQWYQDAYTPGSFTSAGLLNRFTDAFSDRLSNREFVADIGLVVCGWSKFAALDMAGQQSVSSRDRYLHEVVGWGRYLSRSNHQWDVLLGQDLARRIDSFQIVILPSQLVVTEEDAAVLARFAQQGGRLVITGETGKYQGREGLLMPHTTDVLGPVRSLPNVVITDAKPGAVYESRAGVGHTRALDGLLDFDDFTPVLTTTASPLLGMNLVGMSLSRSKANPGVLSLDLVNYNVNVAGNTMVATRPFSVTVQHPDLTGLARLQIEYICPEMEDYGEITLVDEDQFSFASEEGRLTVQIPTFANYRVLFISEQ